MLCGAGSISYKLQKRAFRLICKVRLKRPCTQYFSRLGTLTSCSLYILETTIFTRKKRTAKWGRDIDEHYTRHILRAESHGVTEQYLVDIYLPSQPAVHFTHSRLPIIIKLTPEVSKARLKCLLI